MPPVLQVEAIAAEPESDQTESEGPAQSLLNLLGIQPWAGEGVADEVDRRLHPECREQPGKLFGKAGQGVEQVCQAHEIVIAFHGIPVFGEGMFVGIALVLFHQETGLDPPAVTGAQITPGVYIQPTDRTAGDPSVFHLVWHNLQGFGVDLFPLLVAEHNVEVDVVFSVGSELVTDLVDPLEVLSSLAPRRICSNRLIGRAAGSEG